MSQIIWTAWNNGAHKPSGAGYGFKIAKRDLDQHFRRSMQSVKLQLPTETGFCTAEPNIDKDSFWSGTCRELISKDIGKWLLENGYAPWPKGKPPKFIVRNIAEGIFRLVGKVAQ